MPSQAACRGKSQPHEGPCPGSLSCCSTQGRVQPEGVRTVHPLLFPYELPCHAQGWDTGPKVGRGAKVLQNCYLDTHSPVHHPCMRKRKEEGQEQAMPV